MNILETKNVILVSLVILCFTNTIESRPNGNSLFKVKTRYRRNKNEFPGTTNKWFRRHPSVDRLSSQRHLIRELFSSDNRGGRLGNPYTRRWYRGKIGQLERKYLNNDFRGDKKSRLIPGRRRKTAEEKNLTKENHRVEEPKRMRVQEFMSLVQHRRFDYEHIISTLKSQQLTESQLKEYDTTRTTDDSSVRVAFNLTAPTHRMTDRAKLIVYISREDREDNINTPTRGSLSCKSCDLQIRELVRTSDKKAREGGNVITVPKTSIKYDAWNSFDISDIIKTSDTFIHNTNGNNTSTPCKGHNSVGGDIQGLDCNDDIVNNINNMDGDDNKIVDGQPSSLLCLSFKYLNCSFPNNEDTSTVSPVDKGHDKDLISTQNRCSLNTQPVTSSSFQNDDKSPLLLLVAETHNNLKDDKPNSDKELTSSTTEELNKNLWTSLQHGVRPKLDKSTRNKRHILELSGSKPFPNTSGFRPNTENPQSINVDTSNEFQTFQNNSVHDPLPSSPEPKSRSKRRARRHRRGRNSCRRKEMYVDFSNMKWADFIAYPRGYQAYQCVGRCYSPISKYLSPTIHAIIQNLVHANQPRKAGRSCCVPTKLRPMSIMFYDKHKNPESKELEGMIVAECGCR